MLVKILGNTKSYNHRVALRKAGGDWNKEEKQWQIDGDNFYFLMFTRNGLNNEFYFANLEIVNKEEWEQFKKNKHIEVKAQYDKEEQNKKEMEEKKKQVNREAQHKFLQEAIKKYGREKVVTDIIDATCKENADQYINCDVLLNAQQLHSLDIFLAS